MVVVGIFGSRNGYDESVVESVLLKLKSRFGDRLFVVVGDCVGVDEITYRICKKNGIRVGVIAVRNNWSKISYSPSPDDVIEVVGELSDPLKSRLSARTRKFFEYVHSHNGCFIGFNTSGRGSQIVVRLIRQHGVPPSRYKLY